MVAIGVGVRGAEVIASSGVVAMGGIVAGGMGGVGSELGMLDEWGIEATRGGMGAFL